MFAPLLLSSARRFCRSHLVEAEGFWCPTLTPRLAWRTFGPNHVFFTRIHGNSAPSTSLISTSPSGTCSWALQPDSRRSQFERFLLGCLFPPLLSTCISLRLLCPRPIGCWHLMYTSWHLMLGRGRVPELLLQVRQRAEVLAVGQAEGFEREHHDSGDRGHGGLHCLLHVCRQRLSTCVHAGRTCSPVCVISVCVPL